MKLRKHIFSVISTIASYSLVMLLTQIILRKDLNLLENLDIQIQIPLFIFISSSVTLFILLLKRNRELQRNQEKENASSDKKFIQGYIEAVGAYLGAESEEEERKLYRSMAAGIYLHIPHRYWTQIDKIDEQIVLKHTEEAWKELKLFSQSLNEG